MNRNTKQKRMRIAFGLVLSLLVLSMGLMLYWRQFMSKETTKVIPKEALKVEKYEVDFKQNSFTSGVELSLLKEIGICDTTKVGDAMGACSPKFFKFFPLSRTKSLRDGFILLINGLAFADPEAKFPIRRILIFEREGGVLVAVNKFKGNLIERRQIQDSDYDDLVIRFRLDQYNEKYHVVYRWKNNKYQLAFCEELVYFNEELKKFEGGRVLATKRDSVSREVEKILIEEHLVF
ncbi:MAG: hypothetical protein EBR54_03000 [Flavobacteriia bacterium]|nr:hypothetical protein [Flavobacteriia bacterium]